MVNAGSNGLWSTRRQYPSRRDRHNGRVAAVSWVVRLSRRRGPGHSCAAPPAPPTDTIAATLPAPARTFIGHYRTIYDLHDSGHTINTLNPYHARHKITSRALFWIGVNAPPLRHELRSIRSLQNLITLDRIELWRKLTETKSGLVAQQKVSIFYERRNIRDI